MKRIRLSSSLGVLIVATASGVLSGCGSTHFIRASSSLAPREDAFEDVMITGSHIVYRVPQDKTITPIHVPPKISPLTPATVDAVDGTVGR